MLALVSVVDMKHTVKAQLFSLVQKPLSAFVMIVTKMLYMVFLRQTVTLSKRVQNSAYGLKMLAEEVVMICWMKGDLFDF